MLLGVNISLVSKLRSTTAVVIPTGAIRQRDGGYILDRAGNYIEVRA